MLGRSAVIRADALSLPLADRSVDLVVTSPPYFQLRSYQDNGQHYDGQIGDEARPTEFVEALVRATSEMVRVLRPAGSIWVNLGDKYIRKSLAGIPWRYAIRCTDDIGLTLRAEVIWNKTAMPETVKDRPRRTHEHWFHLTTTPGDYFSNIDAIREPAEQGRPQYRRALELAAAHGLTDAHAVALRARGLGDKGRSAATQSGTGRNTAEVLRLAAEADAVLGSYSREFTMTSQTLGKVPGSVRRVPSERLKLPEWLGVQHYAAFPTAWPRWLISAYCPEGGTVLDPFGGTGTTALVARAMGRLGISSDLSHDYCRAAVWRTNDLAQLQNAIQGRP